MAEQEYLRPQIPLEIDGKYIYPLTTYNQIIMPDGSRWQGETSNGGTEIYAETDPTVPAWAKESNPPTYTKNDVGLGNVDNVKQYSADNPPPYPVVSVNGQTGEVTLNASDVQAAPAGYGYGGQPELIYFADYANESTLNTKLQEVFASMSDLTPKQILITHTDGGTILGTLYRHSADYGFFHAAGYNGKILLKTKVNGTWNGYVDFSPAQLKTHTVTINSDFVNSAGITAESRAGILKVGGYLQTKTQHYAGGTSTICTLPGITVEGMAYATIVDKDNTGKAFNLLLLTENGTTRVQIESSNSDIVSGAWLNFTIYGILA